LQKKIKIENGLKNKKCSTKIFIKGVYVTLDAKFKSLKLKTGFSSVPRPVFSGDGPEPRQ
jgi:hypothetical protein